MLFVKKKIVLHITKTRPFNIMAFLWLQKRKVSDKKYDLFIILLETEIVGTL